jgi:hypothetical protein
VTKARHLTRLQRAGTRMAAERYVTSCLSYMGPVSKADRRSAVREVAAVLNELLLAKAGRAALREREK